LRRAAQGRGDGHPHRAAGLHSNAATPLHRGRGADHPRGQTCDRLPDALRDDGLASESRRDRGRPEPADGLGRARGEGRSFDRDMSRWRWRGSVALLAVCLAFFIYPLLPNDDVINSDWPAFANGARRSVSDPGHLYDFDAQKRVELDVTGGRVLVTLGIGGIHPFLAPAWVALLAVPFDAFGTEIGGRLWILFGLLCLAAGLYLATRPRPPTALLPGFAAVPTALLLLNAQLDGIVALGLGAAFALWSRPYLAGLALGLTLVKPQLVLPLAAALFVARKWKVLATWTASGIALMAATLVLNPHWLFDWLGQTRTTVQVGSREVDLPH